MKSVTAAATYGKQQHSDRCTDLSTRYQMQSLGSASEGLFCNDWPPRLSATERAAHDCSSPYVVIGAEP